MIQQIEFYKVGGYRNLHSIP